MNSFFSFFYTGCLKKAKEISLPYYLPIGGGRITRIILFPRLLAPREMHQPHPRFELESSCLFPTTIAITPQTPQDSFVVSQRIGVAKPTRYFKLGLKSGWRYASRISYDTAISNLSVIEGILTHMYHFSFNYICAQRLPNV